MTDIPDIQAKKVLSIPEVLLGSLQMMRDAIVGQNTWRDDALTTELPAYTIDTCCPSDTQCWETGIQPKGGSWYIVEQYDDKAGAQLGHQQWVERLTANLNLKLRDIIKPHYSIE